MQPTAAQSSLSAPSYITNFTILDRPRDIRSVYGGFLHSPTMIVGIKQKCRLHYLRPLSFSALHRHQEFSSENASRQLENYVRSELYGNSVQCTPHLGGSTSSNARKLDSQYVLYKGLEKQNHQLNNRMIRFAGSV